MAAAIMHAGAYRLDWRVEDLGLDSRVVEIDGARPGTFDYRLAYRQIPRHRFDTTSYDIHARIGQPAGPADDLDIRTARRGLRSTWRRASFAKISKANRKTLEVGGRYLPTTRFRLFADFQRQDHDGTSILGGSYFTNSSLLPHQFDYQTDQVDAGIRYDADKRLPETRLLRFVFQRQYQRRPLGKPVHFGARRRDRARWPNRPTAISSS